MHFDVRFRNRLAPFFLIDASCAPIPEGTTPATLEQLVRERGGFAYFPHLDQALFMRVYINEEAAEARFHIIGESSSTCEFHAPSGNLSCGQLAEDGTIQLHEVPAIAPGSYRINAMDIDGELMGRTYVAEEMMTREEFRKYRATGYLVGTLGFVGFITFMMTLTSWTAATPARAWLIFFVAGSIFSICLVLLLRLKRSRTYRQGQAAWDALRKRTPSLLLVLRHESASSRAQHQGGLIHRPSYEPYFPDQTD